MNKDENGSPAAAKKEAFHRCHGLSIDKELQALLE